MCRITPLLPESSAKSFEIIGVKNCYRSTHLRKTAQISVADTNASTGLNPSQTADNMLGRHRVLMLYGCSLASKADHLTSCIHVALVGRL